MEINKLYVGQTFKNYKVMCEELGWEVKSSTNSKKAQYKELERHCLFEKDGFKIVIKEVYEIVKDKIDGRGKSEGSRRSIYGNAAQLLITDLLARSHGYVTISKNRLMLSIGMINANYGECSQQVKKLAKHVDINEKFIYDFYNINNSNFTSIIESALNNLEDKSIIMYNKIIKVCEQGRFAPRKATKFEESKILECERETLNELGFEDKSKVRVSNKWAIFKKEVQSKLNKCTEIKYYFSAYEITVNKKYIEQERNKLADLLLEQVVRDETLNDLNSTIIEHFIRNSQERHDNAFTSGKLAKIRRDENYIENMKCLASLLIDKNTTKITLHIERTEELPIDLIDDIEQMLLFG
jgi:hypothetical protein